MEDGYVFRFIYEVKGDALKLCIWKAEPAKRALDFSGEEEHALVILRREVVGPASGLSSLFDSVTYAVDS